MNTTALRERNKLNQKKTADLLKLHDTLRIQKAGVDRTLSILDVLLKERGAYAGPQAGKNARRGRDVSGNGEAAAPVAEKDSRPVETRVDPRD